MARLVAVHLLRRLFRGGRQGRGGDAADVAEGDWIEIGQLGAYGACLRTGFNGFDVTSAFEVRDPAMLS